MTEDRGIWDTTRMLTVVMVDKLDVCIERKWEPFWYRTICQGGRPNDGRVRKECVYSVRLDWLQVSVVPAVT